MQKLLKFEECYIRDGVRCAVCGKNLCFVNAYKWIFYGDYLVVCAECKAKILTNEV